MCLPDTSLILLKTVISLFLTASPFAPLPKVGTRPAAKATTPITTPKCFFNPNPLLARWSAATRKTTATITTPTTIYNFLNVLLVLPTSTLKFCLSANLLIFTDNCNCAHTKCEEGLGSWNQLEPDYVICS
jgi:hypothetical protein